MCDFVVTVVVQCVRHPLQEGRAKISGKRYRGIAGIATSDDDGSAEAEAAERRISRLGVPGGCEAKEEKPRKLASADVGELLVRKLHDLAAMVAAEESSSQSVASLP